jgi:hypothetical protein
VPAPNTCGVAEVDVSRVESAVQRVRAGEDELRAARDELYAAMLEAHGRGASQSTLARVLGISRQRVARLIAEKR